MRAIGYCRVSTNEQGDSGAGLEWQEGRIRTQTEARGWDLLDIRQDVASGKSLRKRNALGDCLRDLAAGRADVLVVAKLDRLSRSVMDFAGLLETAKDEGWSLVVLDMDIDMTTSTGELMAHVLIAMSQWERRVIGERTKAALSAVKARGTKLGRRSNVDPDTLRLIRVLRDSGRSYASIAAALTGEGVATAQGGAWHAATVRKLYATRP